MGQMARKAYKALVTCGCPLDSYDDWRREQQRDATGIESMVQMEQQHYVAMYNHYAAMSNGFKMKDHTWTERDKAIHILRDAMKRHEITPMYLWSIVVDKHADQVRNYKFQEMWEVMRTKFTRDQIMQLVYTINNRGRSQTAVINSENGLDHEDIHEPHASPSTMPPGRLAEHFNVEGI